MSRIFKLVSATGDRLNKSRKFPSRTVKGSSSFADFCPGSENRRWDNDEKRLRSHRLLRVWRSTAAWILRILGLLFISNRFASTALHWITFPHDLLPRKNFADFFTPSTRGAISLTSLEMWLTCESHFQAGKRYCSPSEIVSQNVENLQYKFKVF